ncbi:hypothetical protein MXD81_39735 [Microbacteriaceae bacterium K1510]|nr:hypothetical protein [Microbacteriaceae bacterium K1510]
MQTDTKMRVQLAALIYIMTSAVLFGAGLITALTVPALSAQAMYAIPVVVVLSVVLAAPIAWLLAPRLRARYWRDRQRIDPRNVDPLHLA